MSGLISGQMGAPEAPEAPEQEQMEQPGAGGADEGGESPEYQAAVQFAMEALYKNGGAKQLAQAMRSADDPVKAMADAAYQMMQIVDEQTDATIPDEELVPLAVDILSEVADVAQAAGVQVGGEQVAKAMQAMLLRFVKESGGDTAQLEQAMSQVDMSQFNQVAAGGEGA